MIPDLWIHRMTAMCVAAVCLLMASCNPMPEKPASTCAQLAGLLLATDSAWVAVAEVTDEGGICQVEISFPDSTLRSQVRMPIKDWNARLLFLGGGGFDGVIPTAAFRQFSPSARNGRYVTAATNGGYDYPMAGRDLQYFEATFAYNPQVLEDFTHASEHRALLAVLSLIQAFYGKLPEQRYFEGCSMGGHDALILAQRYPQDFNGIIARAPAGNVIGLMLQFHRSASAAREPGAALSAQQLALLQSAVLEQCDLDDGLRDGLVSRPLHCNFNADILRCDVTAPVGGCFSKSQMRLVEHITTPLQIGQWQHPGFPFSGAESNHKGWSEYILPHPDFGDIPLHQHFSHGFIRAFVTREKEFDTSTWRTHEWLNELSEISEIYQADDPDLGDFHAHGGKLIIWNGAADTAVSARDSVRYYHEVQATLGPECTGETVELFLAPGVGHCYQGPGTDTIDLVQVLADWVDTGIPPSEQGLVHQKLDEAGIPILSRPACAWPASVQYRGQGNPDVVESFICARNSSDGIVVSNFYFNLFGSNSPPLAAVGCTVPEEPLSEAANTPPLGAGKFIEYSPDSCAGY